MQARSGSRAQKNSAQRILLGALLLLPAFPAHAGWTAKQTTRGANDPAEKAAASKLYFEGDLLRIDQDPTTSVIVELSKGAFTFIKHDSKRWTAVTLDELIAIRDKMLVEMEAALPKMPAELRKMMEEQIKTMKGGKKVVARATGKKDRASGFECEVYTYDAADGGGEACVSTKVGVDHKPFAAASAKLAERLATTPGMAGSASLSMIELGRQGFPVRARRTLKLGPQTVETISELSDFKAEKIDPALFRAPAGYTKGELQEVMGGGPGGPPVR